MLDARSALTQDSCVEWVQVQSRGQKRDRWGLWLCGLLATLLLGACTGPGLEPPGDGRSTTGAHDNGGAGGASGLGGIGGATGGSGGTSGAGGTAGLGGVGGAGGIPIDGSGVGDAALDLDEDAGIEDQNEQ